MVIACGICGGVVELALVAGGTTGIAVIVTHIWNSIRRRLHGKVKESIRASAN